MSNSEKRTGDPFVQQHGQQRHRYALYQIQRRYAEDHKGDHIGNPGPDGRAHLQNCLHGQAENLREFGQQVYRVEETAEVGQTDGAQNQTDDCVVAALVSMIEEKYDIQVDGLDIVSENFQDTVAINKLVKRS